MRSVTASRKTFARRGSVACAGALAVAAAGSVSARTSPPQAKLIKGPYLTGLAEGGVDVRFELDAPAPAVVSTWLEGTADAGGAVRTFDNRGLSETSVVRLTGLQPSSRYAYAVKAGTTALGGGHFTTAPAAGSGAPLTFIVYGDDRSDPDSHAAVVRAIEQVPSDFLVNTGDVVENGGRAQDWQSFFDIESPLLRDRPIYVAIGNHELVDDTAGANFAKYFGFVTDNTAAPPSLSGTVRLGSVRFFFLNAMHDWAASEEKAWLDRELARADVEAGVVWRIAVAHHGPWSMGPHGPNSRLIEARLPETLASHHVDLFLSGHDHIYQRGDAGTLKYIVSGGGGAPLYRLQGNDPTARKAEAAYHFVAVSCSADGIRVVTRRVDGTVLERCGFAKGKAWDCDPPPAPPSVSQSERPVAPPGSQAPGRRGCSAPGGPSLGYGGVVLIGVLGLLWGRRWRGGVRP